VHLFTTHHFYKHIYQDGNTPHINGRILIIIVGIILRARPSLRSREGMGVSSSCEWIDRIKVLIFSNEF
jgi:hypothetical protein